MNRTLLLLSAAGLLTIAALLLGQGGLASAPSAPSRSIAAAPAAALDTTHTVILPGEEPTQLVLPVLTGEPVGGALTLTGKLSGAYVKAGDSEAFAWFELKARKPEKLKRVPVNLALVVDRSGSMAGQKLTDAKRAAAELVRQLHPGDRLALVHYGTDVKALPSAVISEATRAHLLEEIAAITDQGSTNISGALTRAAEAVRPFAASYPVSRVILVSDGQPTEGLTTTPQLLGVVRHMRDEGITVSALGVGRDFNEVLMRGMAEQGGGFTGFIDDSAQLAEIFTQELEQAAGTVARGVELSLELSSSVQDVEVMGLTATRSGRNVRVPLYDLAGDQSVRVVVKLTLTTRVVEGWPSTEVVTAEANYLDVARDTPAKSRLALSAEVTTDDARVRAHLDRDVRVHAIRALGAKQMLLAADEMRKGNQQEAMGMLDNVRRLFGSSSAALAGELAELDETQAAYGQARDEGTKRRELLNLQKKTMKNFGQSNSY
ncbi:VWA domain-containing protein [Corallococcus sp. M34]|uniref:vWA domain-containing protein n=1 Tax=Citreicoccus inhibens TaxID=2849499 RepID=UPI001C2487F2|nr:VWA domain-containing protein [Citreicoccus inhibens]MBU8900038.1 VWA domain-containing protein [Citreicoccus inhibens]